MPCSSLGSLQPTISTLPMSTKDRADRDAVDEERQDKGEQGRNKDREGTRQGSRKVRCLLQDGGQRKTNWYHLYVLVMMISTSYSVWPSISIGGGGGTCWPAIVLGSTRSNKGGLGAIGTVNEVPSSGSLCYSTGRNHSLSPAIQSRAFYGKNKRLETIASCLFLRP